MVVVGRGLDLQHDAEDEQVDEHQDDRVRERPGEAEHRPLVLGAQVAAEEAAEELAVAEEVEVRRHPELVYGAAVPPPAFRTKCEQPSFTLPPCEHRRAVPGAAGHRPGDPRAAAVAAGRRRCSAPRPAPTGGTPPPPRRSGASASSPASPPPSAPRSSSAASRRPTRSRRSSAGCAILFVAGLVDDLRALNPLAKLGAAGGRRGARPLQRHLGRGRRQRHARVGVGHRLARRDDERVQPARQHGRARGEHGARRERVLRDRRRDRQPEPRHLRRLGRARARLRRLPAVQPAPRQARGRLHGRLRQPGDRAGARLARARRDVQGRRHDARDARPAAARARRADAGHGARDRAAPARGPPGLAGRPRSHLAPARLPRPVREAGRAPADRDRHRPRRDEPGVHGARQRAHHGRRRAAQLRAAAPVRAASSPTPSRRTTRR